ncbi:MAG: DUF5606 domain-containing protein [Chitinophagaceae bacterium]
MEYSKIIAVTGLPGLQELITSKTDGAIVRSLEDNVTKFVSSRIHNFSHLESIEVYTVRDNVNLVDIFQAMEKTNATLPDEKDAKAVKAYFEKVYPEIDFERVYNSDMKKMIKWFSVLKSNNIEIKLSEIPEEEEEIVEATVKKEVVAEKPKKETKEKSSKSAQEVKKTAPATKKTVKEKEEAPKKKAAAAKKVTKEKETPAKKSAPKKK